MSGESSKTKDRKIIKRWTEEREGVPAIVRDTKNKDSGILRINFPGFRKRNTLEEITWDKFFKIFDDSELTFLYQEKTKEGKLSRFFKFIRKSNS